uniref:Clp protease n=1 Tax=Amorphochlora amoebiformis TaxID=1561963 RepID=A0A0H5BIU4_9EUKA|nr:clp protease [Amorphochlora amoebiformis]
MKISHPRCITTLNTQTKTVFPILTITNTKYSHISTKLLIKDVIYVGNQIDSNTYNLIIGQILYKQKNTRQLSFFINTQLLNYMESKISYGLMVNDILSGINMNYKVANIGICAGDAIALIVNSNKGFRKALKNSKIIINPILINQQNFHNQFKITNQFREEAYFFNTLLLNITLNSSLSYSQLEHIYTRKVCMSSSEALELDIIDEIIN